MDISKFYAVCHRDHLICNPMSDQKLDELVRLLDLQPGARVLDIASGKGELLARLAERYGVSGDGVDISPYEVEQARARMARVPGAQVLIHEQDGRLFPAAPGSYDLAMCIGATFTFGGYTETLRALQTASRPGGLVVVGEPFWRETPDPDYLAASGQTVETFGTHFSNVAAGIGLGMALLYAIVSNDDDWDRYQGLQWRAAERYASEHADDPDAPEILAWQRTKRDLYLRWERNLFGWAIYIFRSPGTSSPMS